MLLLEKGYHVVAQVRQNSNLALLDGLEVERRQGDITRPETLPDVVRGVDYVIHNAGLLKSRRRETFFEVNDRGTRNLLQALQRHNPEVRKVVHISSVAAGGPSRPGRAVKESDPPHPITTYGESKLAGEKTALSFADRFNVAVVRPPGVYGPGDRGIFSMFQTVHMHLKPLIGDSKRMLQLVHVDDLCEGVLAALRSETRSGSVYYIAENTAYQYGELIRLLVAACGRWTVPLYLPAPLFSAVATISEQVCRLLGATPMVTREKTRELNSWWEMDVSKARDELGWTSKIPFNEGARHTYQWYVTEGWL
jgi:nucleoside-diphosphate-sugar epimerase